LGWDLLKIAKSEIGSNRANRGNRFLTVIQYCLDLVAVLQELQRVCQKETRIIFVVGYQSTVLGVPFYNSEIIVELVKQSGVFDSVLTQKRQFKNKFGQIIREDLLHLVNKKVSISVQNWDIIARLDVSKPLYSRRVFNVIVFLINPIFNQGLKSGQSLNQAIAFLTLSKY
jgi:Zn-dependent metalloprotease